MSGTGGTTTDIAYRSDGANATGTTPAPVVKLYRKESVRSVARTPVNRTERTSPTVGSQTPPRVPSVTVTSAAGPGVGTGIGLPTRWKTPDA